MSIKVIITAAVFLISAIVHPLQAADDSVSLMRLNPDTEQKISEEIPSWRSIVNSRQFGNWKSAQATSINDLYYSKEASQIIKLLNLYQAQEKENLSTENVNLQVIKSNPTISKTSKEKPTNDLPTVNSNVDSIDRSRKALFVTLISAEQSFDNPCPRRMCGGNPSDRKNKESDCYLKFEIENNISTLIHKGLGIRAIAIDNVGRQFNIDSIDSNIGIQRRPGLLFTIDEDIKNKKKITTKKDYGYIGGVQCESIREIHLYFAEEPGFTSGNELTLMRDGVTNSSDIVTNSNIPFIKLGLNKDNYDAKVAEYRSIGFIIENYYSPAEIKRRAALKKSNPVDTNKLLDTRLAGGIGAQQIVECVAMSKFLINRNYHNINSSLGSKSTTSVLNAYNKIYRAYQPASEINNFAKNYRPTLIINGVHYEPDFQHYVTVVTRCANDPIALSFFN
jgi:hypothetical protein